MNPLPPLALYVHVPWCVRKCPYCDFNSHAATGPIPEQAWLERIRVDLDAETTAVAGRSIRSIFVGGGTPSLLSAGTVAGLLEAVAERWPIDRDAEITLEANPGTAEAERFRGYREAGVNRLSIGVQSFDDDALGRLGRIHGGDEARRAIDLAHAAGFTALNVDLMHGLPGQTHATALADLDTALAAGVDHLSWYQLTIEPNTAFQSRPPVLPGEAILAAIEDSGAARLRAAGLARYEVSAWARPGAECRHNLGYWQFGDYLGVGPGAHGKTSARIGDGLEITRTRRTRVPRDWFGGDPLGGDPLGGVPLGGDPLGGDPLVGDPTRGAMPAPARNAVIVESDALAGEFMMNALRLVDGVDDACFTERTGLDHDVISDRVASLRARGLLREDRLATTETGLRFLDRVVGEFLI